MPSRSIGDFRLKYSEFNFHTFAKELGYRRPIPHYTGPYITHVPDIQVFELSKKDKWLVLATDGMWDQISRKQSAKIVGKIDFSRANEKNPLG
jgi:pyruvate dehydrogenase phosphatase